MTAMTRGTAADEAGEMTSEPADDSDLFKSHSFLGQHKAALTAAAACVAPILYLLFVTHYSINVPNEDDWTVVPLVHAVLHGHLTLSALWAQHNENRMLFPNIIFVVIGDLTHDDTVFLIVMSAATMVASYFVFLAVFRSYALRSLTPLIVLILGGLWFSIEDWENAFLGFQLAWYMILLCLVVMLQFLLTPQRSQLGFAFAVVVAVIASFSSFQGLALWPVGLICLIWALPGDPRLWIRRRKAEALVWLGAAAVTLGVYFWGYTSQPSGFDSGSSGTLLSSWVDVSPSFALHHPAKTVEFVLVLIGEVIPNTHVRTLWLNGLLGTVLFVGASFVVFQCVRHRRGGRNCLPVALIIFGLLYDLFIAVGRVAAGVSLSAPTSRYTMPNLLIVIAIVTYAWVHLRLESDSTHVLKARILLSVAIVFLVVQLVVATSSGIAGARTLDQRLETGARLVVNLNKVPLSEQGCYGLYGIFVYVIFYPSAFHYPGFSEAQEDHLNVFAPGPLQRYRAAGLPNIPQCRAHG